MTDGADSTKQNKTEKEMKITKIALASIALACFSSLSASAKNEVKTAYIFGFASSFNDSTVYFTDVQKVDSAYFTRKSKFLISRENYSYQLRDYLEQKGAGNRTCIVMFDFNQKKAEKKWNKLYARYIQKPKAKKAKNGQQMNDAPSPYQVKTINSTDFHFSSEKGLLLFSAQNEVVKRHLIHQLPKGVIRNALSTQRNHDCSAQPAAVCGCRRCLPKRRKAVL